MVLNAGYTLGGRYEIIGKIGAGGMSDVYKARDNKLNRLVAIKVLKEEFASDTTFVERFRMEAQSAACLQNSNIVGIYDVGEELGIYYIVMEYIDGITVKKYIERKGKLGVRETIEVAMQVAYGLEAAHSEHIIHRDIKPHNIMISKEGKVKVTDFGIARAASTKTVSNSTMGSAYYFSPEQARGGFCDERSDIYSLGVTMYEMVTGIVPFDGDTPVAIGLKHLQTEPISPAQIDPQIPVSLEKIILKCMQKNVDARYFSASELIDDLKKALATPNVDFVVIRGQSHSIDPITVSSVKKNATHDDIDSGEARSNKKKDKLSVEEEEEAKFEKLVTYIGIGVAILIVLILTFVALNAFGVLDFGFSSESSQVEMIDLKGLTSQEALNELDQLQLKMSVTYGQSNQYKQGQIYEQDVEPGAFVTPGTIINVKICSGSAGIKVPEGVEGLDPQNVKAMLEQAGFTNVNPDFEEEDNSQVPPGSVIRLSPASGSMAPADAEITIYISKGEVMVTLPAPDLSGLTEDEARAKLASLKLHIGSIIEKESSSVKAGRVISQTPEAGTTITEGTSVDIVLSKSSDTVSVPNLFGSSLSDAKKELKEVGLVLGDVDYEHSDTEKGLVIGQTPSKNSKVKKGDSVDIVISEGPEPTQPSSSQTPTEPSSQSEAPSESVSN